jgi:hypothetical protein
MSPAEPFENVTRRVGTAALEAVGAFFDGIGPVHETMRHVCRVLAAGGVRHGLTGAMALNAHGYRRATVDVDIITDRTDCVSALVGLDPQRYARMEQRQRSARDLVTGVRIDFFHESTFEVVQIGELSYVRFQYLLETKLDIGLRGPAKTKHLGDVIETMRALQLPLDFARTLREDLRPKFVEYWHAIERDPWEG